MENAQPVARYDYQGVLISLNGKLEKYNGNRTEQLMKENVALTGWDFYLRPSEEHADRTLDICAEMLGEENVVMVACFPEDESEPSYREIYTRGPQSLKGL